MQVNPNINTALQSSAIPEIPRPHANSMEEENGRDATLMTVPEAPVQPGIFHHILKSEAKDDSTSKLHSNKMTGGAGEGKGMEEGTLAGKRKDTADSQGEVPEKKGKGEDPQSSDQDPVQLEGSHKGKKQLNPGRWTKEEHKRFIEALDKFGKNWKKVEAYVGSRTGTQVRSHAQKYFMKTKEDSRSLARPGRDESVSTITVPPAEKSKPDVVPEPKRSAVPQREGLELQLDQLEKFVASALKRLSVARDSLGNLAKYFESLRNEFAVLFQGVSSVMSELQNDPVGADRCSRILMGVRFGLEEIDKSLKVLSEPMFRPASEAQYKFLQQYMEAKYGLRSMAEVESRFTKLSDWVETGHADTAPVTEPNNTCTSGQQNVHSSAAVPRFRILLNSRKL